MTHKSEYGSLSEWKYINPKDYQTAYRKGLLTDICESFGWTKRKPNGYWTKERCLTEARKYNYVSDWSKNSSASLDSAYTNGWVEECKAHMSHPKNHKPIGYWTKEKVLEITRTYKTKKTWRKKDYASFRAAQRLGCVEECTSHMENLIKTPDFWTKEKVFNEALKHERKIQWYKDNTYTYKLAQKKGWFGEATKHMI